jgi:shikimate kinase
MGAGKTTVGELLAHKLGWRFVDVDVEIESDAGAPVAELFASHGEPWFRRREHETIRQLLNSSEMVLALGGGAIEDERTRALLLASRELSTSEAERETWLIHLEASLETVLSRCHGTESVRPVFADRANLESRYRLRLPLYRQSHLTIAVDSLSPEAVVETIMVQTGITSCG